jgi:pilus assembly protein Flp/PilA
LAEFVDRFQGAGRGDGGQGLLCDGKAPSDSTGRSESPPSIPEGEAMQKLLPMETIMRMIVAIQLGFDRARENGKDRGATATEYALLVALVAIVIAVGVGLFGTALNNFFTSIATTVDGWV